MRNPKIERRKTLEYVTNQKQVERQILELVKTYNVLYKRQIYAFFAVDGKEKFVGKALHALLKERLIVIRQIKRCRFHQIKTGLSEHLTMG